MSAVVFALIVLIVVLMIVWALDQIQNPPQGLWLVKIAVILIGVVVILDRAGLL